MVLKRKPMFNAIGIGGVGIDLDDLVILDNRADCHIRYLDYDISEGRKI